jgi:hypothetical protein
MPVHNELKGNQFLSRALKKALGVNDPEGGLERFSETLTPVIDLWRLPEWEYLRSERGFAESISSPAVAARFSAAGLTNPAGSNILCVVTLIRNGSSTPLLPALDTGTFASLAANLVNQAPRPLDFRPFQAGSAQVPVTQMLLQTGDFGAGASRPQYSLAPGPAAGHQDDVDPRMVIQPGCTLFLLTNVVNTLIAFDIRWRERQLRASSDELV